MLPLGRQEDLALGGDFSGPRDPELERIDGTKGNGISVEALARMRYSNLQRHSALPSHCSVSIEAVIWNAVFVGDCMC